MESIASCGFCPDFTRHGKAFGNGVYFGDSSTKSHSYTQPNNQGVRSLLLCRVICGNIERDQTSGPLPREVHCKVAISTSGPSEFVIFEPKQIYPLFLIL